MLAITGVIILAGAATFVILHDRNQKAIAADRARFEQADRDLSNLNEKVQIIRKPTSSLTKKSCSMPHLEYANGQLSCDISFINIYEAADITEVNDDFSSIAKVINSEKSLKHLDNSATATFTDLLDVNHSQRIVFEYDNKVSNIKCAASYFLYSPNKPPFSELAIETRDKYAVGQRLNCGSPAKQPYYPLEN